MTGYDIRWVDITLGRYLKVTETGDPDWDGWTLDPDEGDSPAELRRNADLFNAVADWLEQQEQRADPEWVAAEHAAGKAHATRRKQWTKVTWPDPKNSMLDKLADPNFFFAPTTSNVYLKEK